MRIHRLTALVLAGLLAGNGLAFAGDDHDKEHDNGHDATDVEVDGTTGVGRDADDDVELKQYDQMEDRPGDDDSTSTGSGGSGGSGGGSGGGGGS
ncbi:hypothetical protein [Stutzerimonas azotifigens]|uniref:hypothetical protein n=1 Tax=Stutzerimonas azotifigens TaxID=291995 RepID=UPI00041B9B25|nr:hypothetical protein [Stutzerimonas azotifigens]